MRKFNIEEIKELSYTDFISLIKEENRPSGGKKTIREIAINSFINENSRVLEIGCTNGFSSLEINKLTNCNVIGIDINKNSVENANERIALNYLNKDKIKFDYGNAEDLSQFEDGIFDLIICGNAMSFVSNKSKAFNELIRVLKPNGFISIVPIWYKEEPDMNVINKVNEVLGFDIKCSREKDWVDFSFLDLELYYKKNFSFVKATNDQIKDYVNNMIESKKHLDDYNVEEKEVIKDRWLNIIEIFNENLSLTNYSVILLRKSMQEEEQEIFLTKEV